MALIRHGLPAREDFAAVGSEDALPEGAVIVPFARYRAEREALLARNAPLGVRIEPGERVEELSDDLPRLAVIALAFPQFKDGRAFSSARLLRERLGYKGEIRAVGNVLRDQIFFMSRVGFTAFEVEKDKDAAAFAETMAEFSQVYQPSSDRRPTVLALRQGARMAAE
ncbi:MAG: DUF934 domain-containing protein [Alphaproteobacteria bacterium]|nr:DUF934 domain-containing protein [Alphaproteobacteria bacterium]